MLCKGLNCSYFDIATMDAWEEGQLVCTPDPDYYRDLRHRRQVIAISELLLSQLHFENAKGKKEFRDYLSQMIDGPKFDMRRLKPKKKGG